MLKLAVFLLACVCFVSNAALQEHEFKQLREQLRTQYTINPKVAIALCDQALSEHPLSIEQQIKVHNYKAWFQLEVNQFEASMKTIRKVKNLLKHTDEKSLIYAYYNISGGVYLRLGLYELALEQFRNALPIAEQRGKAMLFQTKSNIAEVYSLIGQYNVALSYYKEYQTFLNQEYDALSQSLLHFNFASTYFLKGDIASAQNSLDKAQALQQENGFTYHLAFTKHLQGKLYLAQGLLPAAEISLKAAINSLQHLEKTKELNDVKVDLIDLDIQLGKVSEAESLSKEVIASAKEVNYQPQKAKALELLARVYEQQGKDDAALKTIRQLADVERSIHEQQSSISLSRASYELQFVEQELEIESLKKEQAILDAEARVKQMWLLSIIAFTFVYAITTIYVISLIRRRNTQLKATLIDLKSTQKKLIEAEKMSSLGELVTGIAHHLNTPIGLVITANSSIKTALDRISRSFKQKTLSASSLNALINDSLEGAEIVDRSSTRLTETVERFKEINTSIADAELKTVTVSEFLNGDLKTVLAQKANNTELHLSSADITIDTYPNIISEILKELVENSMMHGFKQAQSNPVITISCYDLGQTWQLKYADNGAGFDNHNTEQVYTPFFSSKLSTQLGLGLTIVYNSVIHILQGEINTSSSNKGVEIVITLPKSLHCQTKQAH